MNIQPGLKQIPKLFMVRCVGEPACHTNNGKLWFLRCSWRITES